MLDRGLAFGCQRIGMENTLSTLFVRERVLAAGGSCMGAVVGSAARRATALNCEDSSDLLAISSRGELSTL
jgi:hypothetical protein